jgi:hypothetical protein
MPGEASAHKLSYIEEVTRNTTPATPVFTYLPDSKCTIALTKENIETGRLNGDRFPDVPRTGADGVGGDIPSMLSFKAYDPFLESALQGLFVENVPGDDTLLAGDTRKSFTILREFSDFAPGSKPFIWFTGCEVSTMAFTSTANSLVEVAFTFFGQAGGTPELLAPTGTTYLPAITTDPFDSFSGEMKVDGLGVCIVTDFSFNINNGHAPKYTVGCKGTGDPSVTQEIIDGSFTVYYENESLYESYVNETLIALELTLTDPAGNDLIISMPKCKIGTGTQPDVTEDGPVQMTVNFTAHKDDTLTSHISVQRIDAP